MSRQPYAKRMRDLDDLQGVTRRDLTDDQRAAWAVKYEGLRVACVAAKVRRSDAVSVLRVLVDTTNPATGLTDQAVSQLAVKCDLGPDTVKRCLQAITQAGLLESVKRGGGPRKAGNDRPQPTVRRLTFLTDHSEQVPVDSGLTERTEVANSAHQKPNSAHLSAPPYAVPTPTHLPARASSEAKADSAISSGGTREAQKDNSTDPWADTLAERVAWGIYNHEASQGRATKVTHPEAVVRKNKRPLAEAWVRGLLQRSDAATIRHLPPDDRDLIAWGVACALGETGVGPSGQAVPRAKELERAAELRKAV